MDRGGNSPAPDGPGDAMRQVGMRDVASHAGVSIATVSRFINEPDSLSPDMRSRVENAVRELGYIRHGAARVALSTVGMMAPMACERRIDSARAAPGRM